MCKCQLNIAFEDSTEGRNHIIHKHFSSDTPRCRLITKGKQKLYPGADRKKHEKKNGGSDLIGYLFLTNGRSLNSHLVEEFKEKTNSRCLHISVLFIFI